MKINRKQVILRNHPILHHMDTASPLTVGNGEFAFTADITGLQTFYEDYQELPLCTMSQWGWHTIPADNDRGFYTLEDLVMTQYEAQDRKVKYPVKRFEGNETVHDWLRQNPHRLNLGRVALAYESGAIPREDIDTVYQELHLYEGRLESNFHLADEACMVETCCDSKDDTLAVKLHSRRLSEDYGEKRLIVKLLFPYGSPDITASDWTNSERHTTRIEDQSETSLRIWRELDLDSYQVEVVCNEDVEIEVRSHEVILRFLGEKGAFLVDFRPGKVRRSHRNTDSVKEIFGRCLDYWRDFWEQGGIADFGDCTDERASELERRIILSQYLLAINSMGSMPPQETGLTCNSWYGKMHLEMYFWHCAWAPLWNHPKLLKRSLDWYVEHITEARGNAARNNYRGARWPKMVAGEAVDCPSAIAPLLVWQQPHIILMLEILRRQGEGRDFMEKYWCLVKETADFMADFAWYNEKTGTYELTDPIIPVQECHDPMETKNPTFELEYWRYGLNTAVVWAEELGKYWPQKWKTVADYMAPLPKKEGLYLAHEWCPDTFIRFNIDHPSMLMAYGVLDGKVDEEIMKNTLMKIVDCWQYERLWGWDFAVMAMTATRLGLPNIALDLLLKDTAKNEYVVSGNNLQRTRKDLPLYLPGNGSLLLAAAMMLAGYDGGEDLPGFPKDGTWNVRYENISSYI